MRSRLPCELGALALVVSVLASPVGAVHRGQTDDFQAPNTAGWTTGEANPNPPVREADGGPQDAGDAFLRIEATGVPGPGGNLVAFNTRQWAGDYLRRGVTAVRADLRNLGASELVIRLLLEGPEGGVVTVDSALLPPAEGWRGVSFRLRPEFLEGGAEATSVLSDVRKLRILHAPSPSGSARVEGALGVDNITALSSCEATGVAGPLLGVCVAYCDVLGCGVAGSAPPCAQLARAYERRAGEPLADADCDGVEGALDNCPGAPNPDQADLDEDGFGDVCDNCPEEPNPGQEDTFGEPGVGDACDCPCFDRRQSAELAATLSDPTVYEALVCVDTRGSQKPLTFLSALRLDGEPCAAESEDCSLVAAELTEDNACQYNPMRPEPQVLVDEISTAQREACRLYVVDGAAASGIGCN